MVIDLVFRFLVGGLVVCIFAVIGDMLQPKTFAGIFGAAPSVALATLGLTLFVHGGSYAGIEGKSMMAGAVALVAYSLVAAWFLHRRRHRTLPVVSGSLLVWLAVAFGIWGVGLR